MAFRVFTIFDLNGINGITKLPPDSSSPKNLHRSPKMLFSSSYGSTKPGGVGDPGPRQPQVPLPYVAQLQECGSVMVTLYFESGLMPV